MSNFRIMNNQNNNHVVLVQRPGTDNPPKENNFELQPCDMTAVTVDGEIKIENMYISVDPALRCQMNEDTGADYLKPWQLGETVIGLCGVGRVAESRHPDFVEGDLVQGVMEWPWKKYFVINVNEKQGLYQKVDPSFKAYPSLALSVLVGLTSIIGIHEVGKVKSGQTLVVSAAAGACGSLAGQIGKLEGCTVLGICGSDEKCQWITGDLGFDHAINYKTENVQDKLAQLCPSGVDVYFDNVGGEVSDAVIKQMKTNSVVILCGQISQYNKNVPYPPPLSEEIQQMIQNKNIQRDRYLVLHYKDKFEHYTKELMQLLQTRVKYRETVTEGLENTGKAFVSMMSGGNIGKQIVKV